MVVSWQCIAIGSPGHQSLFITSFFQHKRLFSVMRRSTNFHHSTLANYNNSMFVSVVVVVVVGAAV